MAADVKFDVLIAGAGPAGLASALYLLRKHPELRGRVAALEKARHPRFKICAGGLIPKTMHALGELELELEVPAVTVMRGTAQTTAAVVDMDRGDPLLTVIRRDQFDAWLARKATEAGLEIIEQCRVTGVEQSRESVRVATERGVFEAAMLIGADGSGSRVRSAVFERGRGKTGRALMADVAVDAEHTAQFVEQRYAFDFRCVEAGVSGYAWSFPCLIAGRPHLNVGIYDQRPRGDAHAAPIHVMREQLQASFPGLGLTGARTLQFKAFPIRWFDEAASFARGRVILAGDAAGVDPLMGEGISCAFEHGKHAATAVTRLLSGEADALARYDAELHHGTIGRKLRKLEFAARCFYGPHHRLYFRLVAMSRTAQEVGVDWYNGADRLDELSTRSLVARWLLAVLFGVPLR
jgi:geranylgeranyl reductase family protein